MTNNIDTTSLKMVMTPYEQRVMMLRSCPVKDCRAKAGDPCLGYEDVVTGERKIRGSSHAGRGPKDFPPTSWMRLSPTVAAFWPEEPPEGIVIDEPTIVAKVRVPRVARVDDEAGASVDRVVVFDSALTPTQISERQYTLAEAKTILSGEFCVDNGHRWRVEVNGKGVPYRVSCEWCETLGLGSTRYAPPPSPSPQPPPPLPLPSDDLFA